MAFDLFGDPVCTGDLRGDATGDLRGEAAGDDLRGEAAGDLPTGAVCTGDVVFTGDLRGDAIGDLPADAARGEPVYTGDLTGEVTTSTELWCLVILPDSNESLPMLVRAEGPSLRPGWRGGISRFWRFR